MKEITKELAEERGYKVYDYDYDLKELYIEMLDEVYGEIDVCGSSQMAGSLLEDCDPTMFRCGMSDWSSEEFEELDNGYMRKDDYEELENILEEEEEEPEE
jgi:hypothetical protein